MDCINTMAYRVKVDDGLSDNDSSDDNGDNKAWKGILMNNSKSNDDHETSSSVNKIPPSLNKENCKSDLPTLGNKRKKNTVWCNVIQEQLVSDDLGQFGLKKKPSGSQDRSCESYDFTRRFLDQRPGKRQEKMDADDESDDADEVNSLNVSEEKPNKHFHKNSRMNSSKYSVKETEDMKRVARKIISVLNEPKQYLIYKVVEILGPQKSLEILKKTESIESSGGMLIKDNSRRRTAGGVFFQVLKNDSFVSKTKIAKIFADERKFTEDKKKVGKKKKKKNKRKNIKITFDVQMDQDRVVEEDKEEEDKEEEDEDKMVDEDKTLITESCLVARPISSNLFEKDNSVVTPVSNEDSEIEEGEIAD